MIGRELVDLLQRDNLVTTVSLDLEGIPGIKHVQADLTEYSVCKKLCEKNEYIFHLAGVKGSPDAAKNRPASFFVPMLQFNTNMMRAAFETKCRHYLYTSSVGVYQPAEVFKEEDTETTVPSRNDWYAGWAKRVGEMQAEAYRIQAGWSRYSVIRPANVYGSYDNFDVKTAMIIPTLIHKMVSEPEKDLELMGDGSNIRDFVHARDVARAMIHMTNYDEQGPMNIGCGVGISIKELVETLQKVTDFQGNIVWLGGPSGDAKRVMDIKKILDSGFKLEVSLEDGLRETVEWYKNSFASTNRTNYFQDITK